MPRKIGAQAALSAIQERRARFRLMLRNKEFQDELRFFRKDPTHCVQVIGSELQYSRRLAMFEARWSVHPFMFQTEDLPDLSPETIVEFESIVNAGPMGKYLPSEQTAVEVFIMDTFPEDIFNSFQTGDILIRVDPRYTPLHILTALIEKELKQAMRDMKTIPGSVDGYQREGKRLRLDSIDFQLQVYDEVMTHYLTRGAVQYQDIALRLKRSRNTVRSAYWAACYKIGADCLTRKAGPKNPGDFDKCEDASCRAAQNESDLNLIINGLCKAHRVFYQKYIVAPSSPHEN